MIQKDSDAVEQIIGAYGLDHDMEDTVCNTKPLCNMILLIGILLFPNGSKWKNLYCERWENHCEKT